MNSILSTMNSAMNVAVKEFASKISEQHPEISVENLMLIWNEMSDSPIKGLKKPKESKSNSKNTPQERTEHLKRVIQIFLGRPLWSDVVDLQIHVFVIKVI